MYVQAPLKGQTENISTMFTLTDGGELAAMQNVTMDIFALNMLGSTFVTHVVVGK